MNRSDIIVIDLQDMSQEPNMILDSENKSGIDGQHYDDLDVN